MQEAKEQAILAYFKSPDEAQIASERLTDELDIEDVQIDRFSGAVQGDGTDQVLSPLTGKFGSHASLTNATSPSSPDVGILLGSSPVVSDGADGSMESISGRDILLTVVCPTDKVDNAVQIIDECGGLH